MASAESVKQKLRGLIGSAETATGEAYPDLTTAVAALIAGYGNGSGATILDDLTEIHAWKKYVPEGVTQTEYTALKLSYYNPAAANPWDTVSYADSIKIVNGKIQLVNPKSFVMSDSSDNDVVLDKYIQSGYDDYFYFIPAGATIVYAKGVGSSNTSHYIRASVAYRLNAIAQTLLGYVVADDAAAYPENGEQGGYLYEYQGIIESGGIDTSDATATAVDMPIGVTAYVDGEKVTGTVPVTSTYKGWKDIVPVANAIGGTNYICLNSPDFEANGQMFREGSHLDLAALPGEFGDATAADVVKGKTFTSAAGLKVTGTGEATGGAQITDDGNGNVTISSTTIADDGSGNIVVT